MAAMEQLGIIAQLGAIYAGFLSIFLVFVRREGRFSPADSLWVRSIIYASFGVVFGALIPLAFSLFGFEGARLWRTASFIALAGAILSAGDVARYHIALSAKDREMVGFAHSMIAWGLVSAAIAMLAVNAIGIFGDPAAALYVTSLILTLAVVTTNFITIALRRLLYDNKD